MAQEVDDYLRFPLDSLCSLKDLEQVARGFSAPVQLDFKFPQIYIQGTGDLGSQCFDIARRHGVHVLGFLEEGRNSIGEHLGLPVLPLDSPSLVPAASVIVCVFNISAALDSAVMLRGQRVAYFEFLWTLKDGFPYWCLQSPEGLAAAAKDPRCIHLYERLDDAETRKEFVLQLATRFGLGILDTSVPILPASREYLGGPLMDHCRNATVADVGAYSGDTAERFLEVGLARKVIAMEPDEMNLATLNERSTDWEGRIEILAAAASDSSGRLGFSPFGTVTSRVKSDSALSVASMTLDEVDRHFNLDFVKMDIEGHEARALAGARKLISDGRATWALSAYHRPEDLIALPEFFPDSLYAISFFAHAQRPWDSVMGLIPREPRG